MAEEQYKKALPVGVEFFGDFKKKSYYYVDKTGLIADLLRKKGAVTLFTRPRRFGKSLNMDMLKSFFEIGADASLFEGLDITKEEELCRQHMGKYPVISISLKDVEGTDYQTAYGSLGGAVCDAAVPFDFLEYSEKLSDTDKADFRKLLECDFEKISFLQRSLKSLSRFLYKHYGRKVIILIDEYDVPLDKAYQSGYYKEMVQLIRSLFSNALKTNPYLDFAVVTGCLRIARESIFTGLNNLKVRTISDIDFSEYFGFTSNEVEAMLRYYGVADRMPDVKDWYDGYRFGNTEVYCPWDVICQCELLCSSKNARMESHWENSSSNSIIQSILRDATETTKAEIEALISGEAVEKLLLPELTYTDLEDESLLKRQTYLWSVLYATGYLTDAAPPDGRIHKLVIPNNEVYQIYKDKVLGWMETKAPKSGVWEGFVRAIKDGDAKGFQEKYNKILESSISIRDTAVKKEMKENFYHGMLLGLLNAEESWAVVSNRESGTGYADIQLLIPAIKTGCLMEVKYAEHGNFESACAEAMAQMKSKAYETTFRQLGMRTIHKYGIACYQKSCQVRYEKVII